MLKNSEGVGAVKLLEYICAATMAVGIGAAIFGIIYVLLKVDSVEGRRFVRQKLHFIGFAGVPMLWIWILTGGDMKSGNAGLDLVYRRSRRAFFVAIASAVFLVILRAVFRGH